MFFNAAKSLIYLKRNSLEFYRGGAKEELKFPPTVFQNIEILDAETFEKLTTTFLSNLKVYLIEKSFRQVSSDRSSRKRSAPGL